MFGADEHNEQRLTPETEALIANGLDFLNKAREELEAGQAKFSVASFWTAVEILMKVPLVHEHWTLVCSGKKLERKKYLAGDFQSVSYDEACARLGDVLNKPLLPETAGLFGKIKNHRNRVVHFYHNELSEGDQRQVLTEQADAWFALNRLMRDEWSSLFGGQLRAKLATDETRMLRSRGFYASAKFRQEPIQQRIADELKAKRPVLRCSACSQVAVLLEQPVPNMSLYDELCIVCYHYDVYIHVACLGCQEPAILRPHGGDFRCGACGRQERRYLVINPVPLSRHNMNDGLPAGCTDCEGYNTVCKFDDNYLCTACLTLHDSVEMCAHCTYHSTSVPDLSAAFGCAFCEGHPEAWDDD